MPKAKKEKKKKKYVEDSRSPRISKVLKLNEQGVIEKEITKKDDIRKEIQKAKERRKEFARPQENA